MNVWKSACAWSAGILLAGVASTLAQPCHVGLTLQSITGLNQATVAIESPRGDPSRVYFMAQAGQIRLMRNNVVLTTPVLSITGLGSSGAGYGMALDPQFTSNGYIYFFMPTGTTSSIVRYTRGLGTDTESFDPASRINILTVPGTPTQHTGGWLGFGPDGYLYCALGEGQGYAQTVDRREGKVLRIDVRGDDFPSDMAKNYAVPPNNPFLSGPWLPEVFIAGVRNPWRCSFDRQTGDFYVADVGGGTAEEINIIPVGSPGGMNFGWPCFEGTFMRSQCPTLVHTPPAVDYPRSGTVVISCITGGYVYRGSAIPALRGRYVFGSCGFGGNQKIFSIDPAQPTTSVRWHAQPQPSVLCFGEDGGGELFVATTSGVSRLIASAPPSPDCNSNKIMDACDIAAFTETDFNANGVPDSCERACLADFNASGQVNVQDIFDFLSVWYPGRASADVNSSGVTNVQDVFDFLAGWFAGC